MTTPQGNVTQLYEYSVYGQVAASDADDPNRFMFTGREFDKDTGSTTIEPATTTPRSTLPQTDPNRLQSRHESTHVLCK